MNKVSNFVVIITSKCIYSGPAILIPPMEQRKCGLILQVVLK